MPDRETWRFINSFAPWLSALGTSAAVIVSLYLARRGARLSVRISANIVKLTEPDSPEYLRIAVVNRGFRDVPVAGIVWKRWLLGKQVWVVLPPDDAHSTKLPKRLQYGEEAQFFFPTNTFRNAAGALLKTLKQSTLSSLSVRMLRGECTPRR